jgi:hypothetical protein
MVRAVGEKSGASDPAFARTAQGIADRLRKLGSRPAAAASYPVVEIRDRWTPDDLFIRPTRGDLGVKSEQQMDVVVHHGEPCDGDREDLGKFFDSPVDPSCGVRYLRRLRDRTLGLSCALPNTTSNAELWPVNCHAPGVFEVVRPEVESVPPPFLDGTRLS